MSTTHAPYDDLQESRHPQWGNIILDILANRKELKQTILECQRPGLLPEK